MDIDRVRIAMKSAWPGKFDLYERRSGRYQLIFSVFHQDGDMVDVYLTDSPLGEKYFRICDFGLTLLRLSFVCDMDTEANRQWLESSLFSDGVQNDSGNFYIEATLDTLCQSILRFAGCVRKVCDT